MYFDVIRRLWSFPFWFVLQSVTIIPCWFVLSFCLIEINRELKDPKNPPRRELSWWGVVSNVSPPPPYHPSSIVRPTVFDDDDVIDETKPKDNENVVGVESKKAKENVTVSSSSSLPVLAEKEEPIMKTITNSKGGTQRGTGYIHYTFCVEHGNCVNC